MANHLADSAVELGKKAGQRGLTQVERNCLKMAAALTFKTAQRQAASQTKEALGARLGRVLGGLETEQLRDLARACSTKG